LSLGFWVLYNIVRALQNCGGCTESRSSRLRLPQLPVKFGVAWQTRLSANSSTDGSSLWLYLHVPGEMQRFSVPVLKVYLGCIAVCGKRWQTQRICHMHHYHTIFLFRPLTYYVYIRIDGN
jgi:hypothetical protein